MKRLLIPAVAAAALLIASSGWAQPQPPASPPANPPAASPGTNTAAPNFIDANGNGICDRYEAGGLNQHARRGRGYGPGDGTGNRGMGPRDGTGYGARAGAGVAGSATPGGCGPQCGRRGRK